MDHFIEIAASHGQSFTGYIALPTQDCAPGVVLLHDTFGIDEHTKAIARRYAEEGYLVVVPDLYWRLSPRASFSRRGDGDTHAHDYERRLDLEHALDDINSTFEALREYPAHRGKVGVLGFGLGGKLAVLAAAHTDVDCAVGYCGAALEGYLHEARHLRCPLVLHLAGRVASASETLVRGKIRAAFEYRPGVSIYEYECGESFTVPGPGFDRTSASLAYSRSLSLLKKTMGPIYGIERVWKRHTYHKYVTRDADAVMETMVADPYFNDVPTMTGAIGHESLRRFYIEQFMYSIPPDARHVPVSFTVGTDRIVDEFVMGCTHTCEMHWMLPGIEPTGKYFEVAMVAVICFRGDRIDNLHVYWDQATVLAQIGKLDAEGLPVVGIQSARKVLDIARPSDSLLPGMSGADDKRG
ncbi:dienelactone hydrolase family protein [Paraburkholderia rhizosphaerae]|uniref:Carboxymethylenebutenolidase n=1 Tax=Paraburkholderia rhizosphaerae TaxID=480658 RepID=A0A4R8LZS7_9BURK|nr:dienelactone hydrolase family protein [Paraburkholderia rhizosphaerae]TDY54198.1 carboxymethylenebutenolidase [Paraburkholderia rhizosphaerae]